MPARLDREHTRARAGAKGLVTGMTGGCIADQAGDGAMVALKRSMSIWRLSPAQAARLHLVRGDVRAVRHRRVDVTVAFNFSYFVFRTREALRAYFEAARRTLVRDGLFFVDLYGGADSFRAQRERRRVDGFVYVWDQHSVDPISHAVTNFIHFELRDGTRMRRAFRYAERPNRFLFGTDWPLVPMRPYRDFIRSAIPELYHPQVFDENARMLFRL